jgi:hypothetical protein
MRGPNDMGAWILVGVTALNFGLQPVDTDAEERDAKAEAEQDAKDAADREAEQDAKDAAKAKDKAAADEKAQKQADADAEAKAATAANAEPEVEIVEQHGSDCVLVSGNGLEIAAADGALSLGATGGTCFGVLAADDDAVIFEHEGLSIELGPSNAVVLKGSLGEGELGEESQHWHVRYVEDYVYVESVSVAGHVLDVDDGKLVARPRDDARAEQRFHMRLGGGAEATEA